MSDDNLNIWEKFEDIDPKFTKAITGKAYKGTSPNPQYVIKCLTEMFGPVGQGFGWRVVAEAFEPLGQEVLHWCRIEFWHTDRANTFESYGQTKAAYGTNAGKFMVDEDAPKKSLTDAIIKAASHIGIAANIFLGRWDDQKYVAEVNAEYRASERSAAPAPKTVEKPNGTEMTEFEAEVAQTIRGIGWEKDLQSLGAMWVDLQSRAYKVACDPTVIAAKDKRKAELTPPKDADLGKDEIPY